MKIEELYNKNEFYERVISDSHKLITREFKKDEFEKRFLGEIPPRGWDKMSLKNKFHLNTFYSIVEITSKLEALDYSVAFINSYPRTRLWSKNFLRTDYIRYHMEVYYGNIVGIFDRSLLLINHLYDLGFKPQDAKYSLISSNKHLEGEKVLEILKKFKEALKKVRSIRNYIEHQGSLSDKKLDDIRMYEFLLNKGHLDQKLRRLVGPYVKSGFSAYIREKKKEIKDNNAVIISVVDRLFASVSKKYQNKMNSFHVN
jgi:hypothetical protein